MNLNSSDSSFRKQEKGFERKKGDRKMLITEKSPVHQIQWNRIIVSGWYLSFDRHKMNFVVGRGT